MDVWVGGEGPNGTVSWDPGWRVYRRSSDMVDPGPVGTFVFLDMREDSVNTGGFGVLMNGYPGQPNILTWGTDWPASYHHRAGGFSFADGHSEIHRWLDARTMPPITKGNNALTGITALPSPNNKDLIWLQEHATRK